MEPTPDLKQNEIKVLKNLPVKRRNDYSSWIILKNNVEEREYFSELCEGFIEDYGKVLVYAGTNEWIPKKGVQLIHAPLYIRKNNFTKLMSWIKYFIGSAFFLFNLKRKHNLFIVCAPPFLSILGYLYNKVYRKDYILWVDDIYPDILYEQNLLSKNSFIARLWEKINRATFMNAKKLITISPLMKKRLSSYISDVTLKERIQVIPTWVDTNEIRPIKKHENRFAIEHSQINKITVMYSGNFGHTHDTQTLIQVADLLSDNHDINFMFIGGGKDFEFFRNNKSNLKNVKFLSWQPRSNLRFSLACADIGFVTLQQGIEELSMPSKTYYYMAAGAAIIGVSNAPSDLNTLLEKNKCGFNLPPGNTKKIVEKILYFKKNKHILEKYKKRSRICAVNDFSKEKCVDKVLNLL